MAFYRQLLVLTVPSVAVLFGIYWYRRKRGCANSDPGGNTRNIKTLKQELEEASPSPAEPASPARQIAVSPNKQTASKSAPIDIVGNGINSQRSSPIQLTDKQLDIEIEKAKSQKFYEMEYPLKRNSKENTPPSVGRAASLTSRTPSPLEQCPVSVDKFQSRPSVEKHISVAVMNNHSMSCKLNDDFANLSVQSNDKVDDATNKSESPSKDTIIEEVKSETIHASARAPLKVSERSKNNKNSKKQSRDSKSVKRNVFTESIDGVPVDSINEDIVSSSDKNLVRCEIDQVDQEKTDSGLDSVTSLISEEQDTHNVDVDRDSDRSPVNALLASPSINSFFDNHSEGSNDSGKGCSESPSPPPTSAGDLIQSDRILQHQFVIAHSVAGYLIGIKRNFLNRLNEVSAAKVFMKSHPESHKYRICVIKGTRRDIDTVLDVIRQKLPKKKFPGLNLNDIGGELIEDEFAYVSDCYHLNLVECVNNDTIVSCLVSPSQIFLQQPMHPTYPSLHMLHTLMGVCYQDPQVPSLPSVVTEGMVCAAPTANNWYRTQIITTDINQNTSLLKLIDFGGFMEVSNSLLKQIRLDFMMLPFQATEVQLAHIAPVDGGEWAPEAVQVLAGLSSGQLLQAQVVSYDELGTPQVYLYLTLGPQQVISLNQELVVRGLATWTGPEI